MGIPKRLIDCLNENKVEYEILHHPEAVTAQRIAQAEHIKGRHQAKVVMIKSGDQHLMMVLPADHQIDLEKVEKVVCKPVSLDRENEFKLLFPDSAVGAMPPFGNLYGLPTFVDKHLAEQDYIVLEAQYYQFWFPLYSITEPKTFEYLKTLLSEEYDLIYDQTKDDYSTRGSSDAPYQIYERISIEARSSNGS